MWYDGMCYACLQITYFDGSRDQSEENYIYWSQRVYFLQRIKPKQTWVKQVKLGWTPSGEHAVEEINAATQKMLT